MLRHAIIAMLAIAPLCATDVPRVLMPLADVFNTTEFWPTWHGLRAAGYQVVVAAPQAGPVASGDSVYPDALALDPAQAGAFALVISGGKAPAALEEVPLAVELARGFMAAGKPVTAICHGPRLLAKAGVIADRVTTAWQEVRDEVPERWRAGAFGTYIDRAVVRDGNLVTSRYPDDTTAFLRATLEHFAARGGLPVEPAVRRILVINPVVSGETQYSVLRTLPALLPVVESYREWQLADVLAKGDLGAAYDAAVLLDGARTGNLSGDARLLAIVGQLAAAGRPILAQPGMAAAIGAIASEALPGSGADVMRSDALLQVLVARLRQLPPRPAPAASMRPQAFIALPAGFDDRAVAVFQAVLDARGFQVTVLAATTGWQRGLNGLPAEATATYAIPGPAAGAVVVAPGGYAPGTPDPARIAWLVGAYRSGATLVTVGSDSVAVCGDAAFAGLRVAGTHQFKWFYPDTGAKHADDEALRSAVRLVTIQGADQLGAGLRLLEPLLDH